MLANSDPFLTCHDYTDMSVAAPSVEMLDEDSTLLPSSLTTPCKPPAPKKALFDSNIETKYISQSHDVINTLSQLINEQSDVIEWIVGDNSLKIEGLKKSIDFSFQESDIKKEELIRLKWTTTKKISAFKYPKESWGIWKILKEMELKAIWCTWNNVKG